MADFGHPDGWRWETPSVARRTSSATWCCEPGIRGDAGDPRSARRLAALKVTLVRIESTGVYWKPVSYLLEDDFTTWLLRSLPPDVDFQVSRG
jgi:hypothetical protein